MLTRPGRRGSYCHSVLPHHRWRTAVARSKTALRICRGHHRHRDELVERLHGWWCAAPALGGRCLGVPSRRTLPALWTRPPPASPPPSDRRNLAAGSAGVVLRLTGPRVARRRADGVADDVAASGRSRPSGRPCSPTVRAAPLRLHTPAPPGRWPLRMVHGARRGAVAARDAGRPRASTNATAPAGIAHHAVELTARGAATRGGVRRGPSITPCLSVISSSGPRVAANGDVAHRSYLPLALAGPGPGSRSCRGPESPSTRTRRRRGR